MNAEKQNHISQLIDKLVTGEPYSHKNLTVIPLFTELKPKTKYLTLKKGLKTGVLEIIEINKSGSVPELKVINKGKKRILLIDGEELYGAKQNRILNTSILLKRESETIIPVSCTEAGRWNYKTEKFEDSENVAAMEVRKEKMRSVTLNLKSIKEHRSDQGTVWEKVDEVLDSYREISSPTRAMKDVFDFNKKKINEYTKMLPPQDRQRGVIVLINGKIEGLEYVSQPKAFNALYKKILKSYALGAEIKSRKKSEKQTAAIETPEAFLTKIKEATFSRFKSPGHGYDIRINGKNIVGNALEYKSEIIHLAVLTDNSKKSHPTFDNDMEIAF